MSLPTRLNSAQDVFDSSRASEPIAAYVRPGRVASPTTRLGEVAEWLRIAPHPAVAVIDAGRFAGWLTAESVASALLHNDIVGDWRNLPSGDWSTTPPAILNPTTTIGEMDRALTQTGQSVLPVLHSGGYFLGFVGRADLFSDLVRHASLPQIGGMATPLGVYLSTGRATGGAGNLGLIATGFSFFVAQAIAASVLFALEFVGRQLVPVAPKIAFVPDAVLASAGLLLQSVVSAAIFFSLVRLSPLAGVHGAEHQVVHALERAEPLLPERVRRMPRIHPRCGTNLAGAALLIGLGAALTPVLGEFSYLASGLLAFTYWRDFGAWLQQNVTTKPPTDSQLNNGIAAARQLLARHATALDIELSPPKRLWKSGIVQVLLGFGIGPALVYALSWLFPALAPVLRNGLSNL